MGFIGIAEPLRIPVKPDTYSDFGRTLIPVSSDTLGAERRWMFELVA
jgi:hypothetical protein